MLAAADALMRKLFKEMSYAPGATGISTPLLEVLASKRGVCQDYAHLMIACLRSRGLAVRYVSGYL
jgi:transglutaminase-like putative cysteine protease